jgi:hypothetical protein
MVLDMHKNTATHPPQRQRGEGVDAGGRDGSYVRGVPGVQRARGWTRQRDTCRLRKRYPDNEPCHPALSLSPLSTSSFHAPSPNPSPPPHSSQLHYQCTPKIFLVHPFLGAILKELCFFIFRSLSYGFGLNCRVYVGVV